ncbi:MAG: MerR family transcriptional regulator [Sphingomicrobium sp.]
MVQSQAASPFTIGRLASAGGVGVETIRFYQRKGLLAVPPQSVGVRRYGTADIQRLRFIRHAQSAGFTLEQIRELLALDAGEDRERAHKLALERVAALDEQIGRLHEARDALHRLATECATQKTGPCPILSAFDAPRQS